MKQAIKKSFGRLVGEIRADAMLYGILPVPLFMMLAIRYGIPAIETAIFARFGTANVLTPYYLAFDLFAAMLGQVLFAYVTVMVMLTELDEGTARYLCVTPLGRGGYLVSRILIPAACGVPYSIALLAAFSLTGIPLLTNVLLSIMGMGVSVSVVLLVVALARNKVEGMGLIKMTSLLFLGIPAPFFIDAPLQYAAGIFPSYWMTQLGCSSSPLWLLGFLPVCFVWLLLPYRAFLKRII